MPHRKLIGDHRDCFRKKIREDRKLLTLHGWPECKKIHAFSRSVRSKEPGLKFLNIIFFRV
ncbi:MAG: hypothetical protein CMF59_18975 [Leptospiraceae bacterium]|nr:hypothetical protein [Leptospiraceae bacterium]